MRDNGDYDQPDVPVVERADTPIVVMVSREVIAKLGDWSEPLQVRIDRVSTGAGWEMTFRRPEPQP
jgi:hypothetical protein